MRSLTPVFLLLAAASTATGAAKEISWQLHFDDGLVLSKALARPLLLDFWASWCGPCRRMDAEVWTDEKVNSLADRYVFVKVDVDREKSVEDRYFVHGIPTIVIADPWGRAVQKHEGFANSFEIGGLLGQLPSDYGEVRNEFNILEHDAKNGKALHRIGQFYADRHAFQLSSDYYRDALKSDLAKEDEDLREDLTLGIAINDFRDGKTGDARKKLSLFLKAFPDGRRQPEAMLAQVAVALKERKRNDAEKVFQELQRRFPDSQAARNAAAMLAQAK
jgi:thioredoxin-like negative regulator of GroEL